VKIEANARQIRALLALAAVDRASEEGSTADAPGRMAAACAVPQNLLDRYELLLSVGRTPVVVPIARGTCSGCHVRLPTMVDCMARSVPAIHTCPNCKRMLYAPDIAREESGAQDTKPSRRLPMQTTRRK